MKSEWKMIGASLALVANMTLVAPAHAADAVFTDWGNVLSLQAGW